MPSFFGLKSFKELYAPYNCYGKFKPNRQLSEFTNRSVLAKFAPCSRFRSETEIRMAPVTAVIKDVRTLIQADVKPEQREHHH
ncbi:hypothetical protein BH10ACI3_BH10ACI3_23700 [soil metagenome]